MDICADMSRLELQANLFTYSSAMTACQGAWQQVILLLHAMEQGSIRPNAICYTAAIKACEKGGEWEAALAIYQKAQGLDGKDELLCDAALRACQQGMQWRVALDLVFGMSSMQLKPDALCFTAVISACTRASEWESVLQIIEGMCNAGVDDFRIARYDHATQAGSTLDCFKHSVLATVMQCMNADPKPYTYIDTHAGSAVYSLGADRQHLVLRLLQSSECLPWHLASYLDAVRDFAGPPDAPAKPALYPGSPLVALRWLRQQDDSLLFELSPETCSQLKSNVQQFSSARVETLQQNSYWWFSQHLHDEPPGRRRLVLIDPPYEPYEAYLPFGRTSGIGMF